MSFSDGFTQSGVAEFPYPKDVVFKAVHEAVGLVKGMKVDGSSAADGQIQVKVGMSAFSWGENVDLTVVSTGAWTSQLEVSSSAKVGFNITASGKNQKNYRELVRATAEVLERNGLSWAEQMGLARDLEEGRHTQVPALSVADEVKKLMELRDAGALTDDEFTRQKARILDS